MFEGQFFQLNRVSGETDIIELVFDARNDSVNTLRKEALVELEACVTKIELTEASGLIIRSAKKLFSAGADVKAFRDLFTGGASAVEGYLGWVHSIYNRIEDLNLPKVAVINGVAAGGGVELTLLCEYRLATPNAKISLPEVKLGILPGWGGATRLPRIAGVDTAMTWLTSGKNFRTDKAIADHVVDGVASEDPVEAVKQAVQVVRDAVAGNLDWRQKQDEKRQPLLLNDYELAMSVNVARGMVAKVAGPHYPAPNLILDTIEKSARCKRNEALAIETSSVVKCVESGVADALVNIFISDMAVKNLAKQTAKTSNKTEEVGVIGAGIMGGGIAYVTADSRIDVVMKDINKQGLALGLNEANSLLSKQVERGRKTLKNMGETLNRIVPTLHDAVLDSCDLLIEAVVENPVVKEKVLAQVESAAPNAVIASNTSTLMISGLANALKKPENFCGIHFFNPVHKMPLVEVIRGEKTSQDTIAKAVNYVLQLGKTPIVVNDCAGFLINRCLTPYFLAFNQLVVDGGDVFAIDNVLSKGFGWPMGPATLLDVIGLDTASHCIDVMDEAFPERLSKPEINIIGLLNASGQLGQKTQHGFFQYSKNRKGHLKPAASADTQKLFAKHCSQPTEMSSEDVQWRMMLPMMYEAIICLDEGIISSPQEADIAFVYGTGFPPFRGGLFYYMDTIGAANLLEIAKKYVHLGPLYQIPQSLIDRAGQQRTFYS
ncbi:multifunctional fatty acid oxidation complex subunit alpha [Vibrio orientalis CIP 102891 = ATCC 33934]|uniref:enoyl-CoA hydratase n=1 Tax=Vibrio orientalis CIP 102891 = ATCC 33934 TaxID=675816 RepID=C9QLV7_VIBOR|nr:fatty acid oxidation complex subunit alpha FadB [Vibrio orientalis]EEX92883.1 enoyl-CoA hydratase/delta(3)-cis-delta(2)-trans-enoyl-CoA isomerase/3-hydroxyacyl-CoA dehydrogenase/3-hydroxybutyryl-CoA epimerase [Vibrio orientalis CIP 102891 = ATCC 33934]EGU46565.1 multifunctional fatty acid oxidation complex subunit alpha [Vibrio orientalis CIP 102891 = ATCC 33934]